MKQKLPSYDQFFEPLLGVWSSTETAYRREEELLDSFQYLYIKHVLLIIRNKTKTKTKTNKKPNQQCLYKMSQKYVLNLSTHKSGAIIKQHAQMASPVIQPATLHAIRQDNMAVHILRVSLFSRLVNNFLYASHFCHENAMGKQSVQSSLGFLATKSNKHSARCYLQCKKTHYIKYFW